MLKKMVNVVATQAVKMLIKNDSRKEWFLSTNYGKKVLFADKMNVAKKAVEELDGAVVYANKYMLTLGGIELTDDAGNKKIVFTCDAGPAPYTWATGAPLSFGAYPNNGANPVIVFDNDLRSMSSNAIGFIVYHETGHMWQIYIENFNYTDNVLKAAATGGLNAMVDSIEFEHYADVFAAAFIGRENAIAALEETKELFRTSGVLFKEFEALLDERIDYIRSAKLPDVKKIHIRQLSDAEVAEALPRPC